MKGRIAWIVFLVVLLDILRAAAHDPRLDLPEPLSVAEAWNVITESTENVTKLLETRQLPEVVFQIANCSPALRMLQAHAAEVPRKEQLLQTIKQLLTTGFAAVDLSREKEDPLAKTIAKWAEYRKLLAELESHYPPELIHSAVYICPMHPLDRHLKAKEKCTECGMALVRRHILASSVWEKPGEPSMKMAVLSAPLEAGRKATVKIHLTKIDASPVRLDDLIEMHTKKIHLLINDHSLSDYHHEHPRPTQVPGEYEFTFVPAKPGPYRIWADVVPAATGIQEYVIADIPANTPPGPLVDRETVFTSIVEGRKYDLLLNTGGKPVHAGETVLGMIHVTGADDKPFTKLEPVMGAFAHIVGFSEDQHTVIHIHPYGQEPSKPQDRGGPAFGFKLFVPSPGFLRLYGQVQIEGVSQFAPFGLTILPPEHPATQPRQ